MDKKYKTIIILFITLTVLLSASNIYLFSKEFLIKEKNKENIIQENKTEERFILENINLEEYNDRYEIGENNNFTVWTLDNNILFLSKEKPNKGVSIKTEGHFSSSVEVGEILGDRFVYVLEGASIERSALIIDLVEKKTVTEFCSFGNIEYYDGVMIHANCDTPITPRPTSGPNSSITAINLLTGESKTIYEADRETDYYIRQLSDAPTEAHVLIAKNTYEIGTGENGVEGLDKLLNTEYLILDIEEIEFD